jgi:hypothetical protein
MATLFSEPSSARLEGAEYTGMSVPNKGDNSDQKEMTIQVDPSSKLRLRDTEVQFSDLRVGDRVKVTYQIKDGKKIAQTVAAERAT